MAHSSSSGNLKNGLIDFTAGSLGGIAVVYVGQPLDTVKVKMQTFPHLYNGMFNCLKQTLKNDGVIRGLYAGTTPAIMANVAENSVLFAAYGYCQKFVCSITGTEKVEQLSTMENATAGFLAAFFSSFTLCPTELIKCQLQAMRETSVQGLQTATDEQVSSLLLSNALDQNTDANTSLYYTAGASQTIDRCQQTNEPVPSLLLNNALNQNTDPNTSSNTAETYQPQTIDVSQQTDEQVSSLLLNNALNQNTDPNTSSNTAGTSQPIGQKVKVTPLQLTQQIFREYGIQGLFRGLVPTIMREMPGYFFFFGGYEGTRSLLAKPGQSKDDIGFLRTMVAGAVGGLVLWTVIFPSDVIKSRVQISNKSQKFLTVGYEIVKKEGVLALYNGLKPTLVRTIPATAALFVVYEYSKKFLHQSFGD